MKKIISLILVMVMLFAFVGCGGVSKKPAPEELPVMEFEKGNGYTVTGRVTDQSGNPLPQANVIIEKKVRAITDKDGNYKVTSLEGDNKITIEFNKYKFFKNDVVVKGETKLDFMGTNNYSISAVATIDKNPIFGVKYKVGAREFTTDEYGTMRASNNTGKTTVTPSHPSFDFYPQTMEVYASGNQPLNFTAVPKAKTYAVSGYINVNAPSEDFVLPNLTILVDGIRSANVVTERKYDYEKQKNYTVYRYTVYGLNPEKKGGYTLSLVDSEGNYSKETIKVTEPVKNANFEFKMTKKFYFPLNVKLAGGIVPTPEQLQTMTYNIKVVDDKNEDVASFKGTGNTTNAIDAWTGCRISIDVSLTIDGKTYFGKAYTGIVERMMTEDQNFYDLSVDLN
ncbi:MAG: carboxypeptidase-like regulatory domain-containing protein [Clostridia bacterium]